MRNEDAIRSLLSAIAERDLSVLPILADALGEAGDDREDMVRGRIAGAEKYSFYGLGEILGEILFAFPELQDEALFVKGWNEIKKHLRESFKKKIRLLGLRYCYSPKDKGTMVISYANPEQLEWVKQARLAKLDEWPKGKPLFEPLFEPEEVTA